jgi:hypothetical protein
MNKRIRQYIGIFAAVVGYYFVHEGAHLVTALYYGTYRQVVFMGLGMQVDVFAERMTDIQLGIFCLAGAVATLFFGWVLTAFSDKICQCRSKVFKAAMWYITLTMLLLDPVYLSLLCGFFGGGDMNGIGLLLPELPVRLGFGAVGICNGILARKYLLPKYTKAFQ